MEKKEGKLVTFFRWLGWPLVFLYHETTVAATEYLASYVFLVVVALVVFAVIAVGYLPAPISEKGARFFVVSSVFAYFMGMFFGREFLLEDTWKSSTNRGIALVFYSWLSAVLLAFMVSTIWS